MLLGRLMTPLLRILGPVMSEQSRLKPGIFDTLIYIKADIRVPPRQCLELSYQINLGLWGNDGHAFSE